MEPSSSDSASNLDMPVCCLTVAKATSGSRTVGAAVRRKLQRKDMEDLASWEIELFDFTGDYKFSLYACININT